MTCTLSSHAHLLGEKGTDQYIRLIPRAEGLHIEMDVHYGEVPSQIIAMQIDRDHDRVFDEDEMDAFMAGLQPEIMDDLSVDWRTEEATNALGRLDLRARPGADGRTYRYRTVPMPSGKVTLRIVMDFLAEWPTVEEAQRRNALRFRFINDYRLKNGTCTLTHSASNTFGRFVMASMPDEREKTRFADVTEEALVPASVPMFYKGFMEIEPLDRWPAEPAAEAVIEAKPAPPVPEPPAETADRMSLSDRLEKRVRELFQPPVGAVSVALVVLLCMVWGAAHAFTPGHGKTIVGSFLVGAHGTKLHAVLIGLLVTITHTAVVLILAVVAYLMKERFVFPTWLQPLGACGILLVGLNQLRIAWKRLRGKKNTDGHGHAHADGHPHEHGHTHDHLHDHDHDHVHVHEAHAHGGLFKHTHHVPELTSITARDVVTVGISGGLVPCPAAIVLLLFSWQLNLPGLGLTAIVAFGFGLAATLIAVGLLAVTGAQAVIRWATRGKPADHHHTILYVVLPAIGGLVLLTSGLIILMK